MLVLDAKAVERFLPIAACIEAVAASLVSLANGDAVLPLRTLTWSPDRSGAAAAMPAWLGSPRAFGMKALSYFPANEGTARDTHQGAVLLFDPDRGDLIAVVDATTVTAIRTAAASAVATRALARDDATELALLGAGVQARSHLAAMRAVRPIQRVRVWSPGDGAKRFAQRESRRHEIEVVATGSAEEAVSGASIVCTVTSASEPVLRGAWLSAGAHVNAVGACQAHVREIDGEALARSRVFVDRRESARAEAGDILLALAEGSIAGDPVLGELGDVLAGRLAGRTGPNDITLFESLGIAVEDLAAAHAAVLGARAAGFAEINFGGGRPEP